jgi:hypothetical protein
MIIVSKAAEAKREWIPNDSDFLGSKDTVVSGKAGTRRTRQSPERAPTLFPPIRATRGGRHGRQGACNIVKVAS